MAAKHIFFFTMHLHFQLIVSTRGLAQLAREYCVKYKHRIVKINALYVILNACLKIKTSSSASRTENELILKFRVT